MTSLTAPAVVSNCVSCKHMSKYLLNEMLAEEVRALHPKPKTRVYARALICSLTPARPALATHMTKTLEKSSRSTK